MRAFATVFALFFLAFPTFAQVTPIVGNDSSDIKILKLTPAQILEQAKDSLKPTSMPEIPEVVEAILEWKPTTYVVRVLTDSNTTVEIERFIIFRHDKWNYTTFIWSTEKNGSEIINRQFQINRAWRTTIRVNPNNYKYDYGTEVRGQSQRSGKFFDLFKELAPKYTVHFPELKEILYDENGWRIK